MNQQTINAWRIRPRMPFKLYIIYMHSDAHMYIKKRRFYESLNERSLHNKTEMAIGFGFK